MKLNLKKVLVGMLFGIIILFFLVGAFAFSFYSAFLRASGLTLAELTDTVRAGYNKRLVYSGRKVPFLFLGLDKRDDALENTLLTDTMLLGSLDTATGAVTTIALPRDLWIADLQTKINALYFYGGKREGSSGMQFTREEVARITGVAPELVVVLNYLELPRLIDTVGGIQVPVEHSFEDDQYPNPAYVAGEDVPPYITVRFNHGIEHMDGARVLTYIRSRTSADPLEGSDTGRAKRQTIALEALVKKLMSKEVLQNPTTLGALYRFWHENVESTLNDEDIVALGIVLRNKPITIGSVQIPVTGASPVLSNPPVSKYGLWVWEPAEGNWGALQKFIRESL